MAALNRLGTVSTLAASDLLAIFSTSLGNDAAVTLANLLEWMQEQLSSGDGSISQYASPTATGFSVTVAPFVAGGNVFLTLTPSGTFAAGTIAMPTSSTAAHGQEVLVHCTQVVTALTVSGNGASTSGAPTSLAAGSFFRMRYDQINQTWYRVG